MDTSPPVDSSTSSKFDDDDEVSQGDDEICLDDPYIVDNFNITEKIGKGGFGIVDLKPANILIGIDDQEAKIADFGLARVYEMSHADGNSSNSRTFTDALTSNIGTPAYVAPEVKRLTVYGYKADLYSLGIILSEMYLDMGPDRPRIIERLRTQNFQDVKDIPNDVEEVIRSLLSYEPSMRMELERVIDTMSPLEQHQRVEVEADQAEVFHEIEHQ